MSSRPPLPVGFTVRFDVDARFSPDGRLAYGGVPWRMMRLTERGGDIARDLQRGAAVTDAAVGALARRFVDTGLAHPQPPSVGTGPELEVVVPARDRPHDLASCLDALAGLPVVVVDDGSDDPHALARTVAASGHARLVRRAVNGGPAAARNTGAAATTAAALAFVDSDCVVTVDGLRSIARHLIDSDVAAVAPRIAARPATAGSVAVRALGSARSPLDLGREPAAVRPGGTVGYVPSTVLVVRRDAFDAVGGFDEGLRVGEDVDFVWRLADAGWSVRYDPDVHAAHAEPTSWWPWLRRRFRYGTSAGALGLRHDGRLAGPALSGLLGPVAAARRVVGSDLPAGPALRAAGRGAARTVAGLSRWGLPLWWPALVAPAPRRRRLVAITALLAADPLAQWLRRRPPVDPVRYVAASLADDTAYAAGVWVGCVRARTWVPLAPRLRSPAVSEVHRLNW